MCTQQADCSVRRYRSGINRKDAVCLIDYMHRLPINLIVFASVFLLSSRFSIVAEQRKLVSVTTDPIIAEVPRDRPFPSVLKRHDLTVKLKLIINKDGSVRSVTVIKSSGEPKVDAFAVKEFSTWNFAKRGVDIVHVPLTFTIHPLELGLSPSQAKKLYHKYSF